MNDKEVQRLFVAMEVPEEVCRHIETVQGALRKTTVPVRWVKADGVHLTLKFLGDVEIHRVEELSRALAKATAGMRGFRLQPAGLGAFPSLHRPNVLWLAVEGDIEPLMDLQRRVEKSLKKRGFPADRKAFHPHLTIGRVRRGTRHDELEPLVASLSACSPPACASWNVTSFALVRSELRPTGARYTTLMRFPLGEASDCETTVEQLRRCTPP